MLVDALQTEWPTILQVLPERARSPRARRGCWLRAQGTWDFMDPQQAPRTLVLVQAPRVGL